MRLKLVSLMVIALLTGCQTTILQHQTKQHKSIESSSKGLNSESSQDHADSIVLSEDDNSKLGQDTVSPVPEPKVIVYKDIWKRIAATMTFKVPVHNARVRSQLNWFIRHPRYLQRVSKRASPYIYWVVNQLKQRNMPVELALLPVIESAYDPFAYSHGQASGMWQIIPDTAKHLGLRENWWYDGRRDIAASTTAALDYLEWLNKLFNGNWLNAIAAYNSGQGRVLDAIRYNRKHHRSTDFWSLHLPSETEAYVPRLLALCEVVKHPEKYHIKLPTIDNEPYLQSVNIGSQIDLALAAKLAGINLKTLYLLNPGFNRWATDPNGPHRLLIPDSRVDRFKSALRALPSNKLIQWKRHKVVDGDTLNKIAFKYQTTVNMLLHINHLKGNMIRIGQHLLVPISTRNPTQYILSETQRLAQIQSRERGPIKLHYTVRPGDTLWDIGREYHISYKKLARWNGLSPKDALHRGQNLVIWQRSAGTKGITRKIVYEVHPGDSLSVIANKFNVHISDLIKWNDLNRHGYLQPGQKLNVYVNITRLNV
ncbi:MAG: Membrane-bound lytic murein transglycosylase D [Candidatus Celerinatantimonas neptuna]|nr:MAG: Membrane-bound lytic murein transglycosylase D [Candidatus Celerinatantimonas neptuna]